MTQTARIIGTGSTTGSERITNTELISKLKEVDYERLRETLSKREKKNLSKRRCKINKLTDEEIFDLAAREFTGVTQRYFCSETESTETMATEAGKRALKSAGISFEEVDCLLMRTFTSEEDIPIPASLIERALKDEGDEKYRTLDTGNTLCCGFVDGLINAYLGIREGAFRTALIIASEKTSSFLNFHDKREILRTVLFGDGAGAAVLRKAQNGTFGFHQGHAPSSNIKRTKGKPLTMRSSPLVLKTAAGYMAYSLEQALKDSPLELKDLSAIVPHPANIHIIEKSAEIGKWPRKKVVNIIDEIGNPSGAGTAIGYDKLMRREAKNLDGEPIKAEPGDFVGICAVAGSYLFSSVVLRC